MMAEQEVYTSEEAFWYENDASDIPQLAVNEPKVRKSDLQLAAELGRTLLDRNKDLEFQLRQSQQLQSDQAKEIDLLTKQLDVLRSVNESRMKIYEDVDRKSEELEKTNRNLQQECKKNKEQIQGLNETISALEGHCHDLQQQLEELQKAKLLEEKKCRRASSVPSLRDLEDSQSYGYWLAGQHGEVTADLKDILHMQQTIKNLEIQLCTEEHRGHELASEISALLEENQCLQGKISELEVEVQRIVSLQEEVEMVEFKAQKFCQACRDVFYERPKPANTEMKVEHDVQDINHGDLVKLKNGGSAFGSRETLHTIGLEPEPHSVSVEIIHSERAEYSTSLLTELENQYRALVKKYEILVEAKTKRNSGKDMATQSPPYIMESPDAKRPSSLVLEPPSESPRSSIVGTMPSPRYPTTFDLRSPVDPTEGHFENRPPEYKRLFKEIFETLRRSVVLEDGDQYEIDGLKMDKTPEPKEGQP